MWKWLKRIIDYPRLEAENAQLRADLRINSDLLIQRNNEQVRVISFYQERAVQLSAALSELRIKLKAVSETDPLVEWATRYSKETHFRPVGPVDPVHASRFEDQMKAQWGHIEAELKAKEEEKED